MIDNVMSMDGIMYGLSGLLLSANSIVIGIRFILRGRYTKQSIMFLLAAGVILLSAAWWPSSLTFLGISLPEWIFVRFAAIFFVPGLIVLNHGIAKAYNASKVVQVATYIISLPILILVIFLPDLSVYITMVDGVKGVNYKFICGLLLFVNILFTMWNTAWRFLSYGMRERSIEAKTKGIVTGIGFMIWAAMAIIDAITDYISVLVIVRIIMIFAQYLVLLGQISPEKLSRVLFHEESQ